ncbi:MAG: 4-(cytidine 5'-diphospho)-2-C-methyl-D-erythritol kinase [Deltaproteobacteria bacterium]|nr:4-(cytidine 5'-diphospho)-2-C-methyl-D-erythritol kinase [Deltaproteobacteria bacterium]
MTLGCATSRRPASQVPAWPTRWLCPAKVNLSLKILGRRADGYHELVTVMQPLSLADELEITPGSEGITFTCDSAELPAGEENLVWRAAANFLTASGLRLDVHLALTKRIPVAAGLGGGSSDAAGTLLALNEMTGHPLNEAGLHDLASRLGADVPFFLHPGPQIGRGIGTDLSAIELPPYWYALMKPDLAVSTGWVYENLDLSSLNRVNRRLEQNLNIDRPGEWVANDLETVTLRHYPELKDHLLALAGLGALAQGMSGSGPTLFGIFPDLDASLKAARRLRQSFRGWLAVARGLTGKESPGTWEKQVWII